MRMFAAFVTNLWLRARVAYLEECSRLEERNRTLQGVLNEKERV